MPHQACYDLAHNPPTFDAVSFIVQVAERFGTIQPVTINIAPGPADGFRADKLWPYGTSARQEMLHKVLVPILELLPNATVVPGGPREGFGAGEYTIPWRHFVRCNAKGVRPLRPRGESLPRRSDLITITLREAEHWPQRNSDLRAWMGAAEWIRIAGYEVVFVRDTHVARESLPGFNTMPMASTSLDFRASLYRSAACNMFVSNGPAWISMACDAPTLVLKPTCEELGRCYDSHWFQRCGIEPGGQFPGSAPYHRLVWGADTMPNIVAAFRAFMGPR